MTGVYGPGNTIPLRGRYTATTIIARCGTVHWAISYFAGKLLTLLQRVHQPRDGAIQIFIRAAQLFDFVDGMQHRGVMLPAELPADLRQGGSSQLFDDVHGHLAR